MIAKKIQREVDALRKILAPLGAALPPLTVPLLDSIEAEAGRVAALEGAAYINLEHSESKGGEHGQAR
jgi:hypothetical protein